MLAEANRSTGSRGHQEVCFKCLFLIQIKCWCRSTLLFHVVPCKSFWGASARGKSVLQDVKIFHKSISRLQRRISATEMCSAQLCPGSREHISRQQIFQLLWKVTKWRPLCQTQHFWKRFSPEIWKKSLMLIFDPVQPGSIAFLYWLGLEISGLLLRICFPFNLCKHSSGDSILSSSC